MVSNQTVLLHLGQLIGHGAAVYGKIVGKLLAVKGDGEVRASVFQRLLRKRGASSAICPKAP